MSTGRLGDSLSLFSQIIFGTDDNAPTTEHDMTVSDLLSLEDVANTNFHILVVHDVILLSEADAVSETLTIPISQTIILTDVAVTATKFGSASSVAIITDLAHAGIPLDESVLDTFTLTDSTSPGLINTVASSIITLVDVAEGDLNTTIIRLPAQPLGLTDTVSIGQAYSQVVEDDLEIDDGGVNAGPINVAVETPLSVTTPNDPTDPTDFTFVGLIDSVEYNLAISNQNIVDYASFSDIAGRPFTESVSDTLALTGHAEHLNFQVDDDLELEDIAGADVTNLATDQIALIDIVSYNRAANPAIDDSLEIEQVVGWVLEEDLCNYAPQGDLDPAPPLDNAVLTLTWPLVGPTHTVVLRNPDFNNQDNLGITRINRQSRGGTLIIYADTFWPKFKTLVLQISGLGCGTDVGSLQDFLSASLGQEIGLLDHEGRQWRGVILNPEMSLTEPASTGKQVQLQFEGDLV